MLAITPVKKNSQRLPGKNFQPLLGRPLLHHAIDTWKRFGSVYVYGNREIEKLIPNGCTFVEERHTPAGQDGNQLFVKMLESLQTICELPEHVAIFNVTSPFIRHATIVKAIAAVESGSYDSAVSAIEIQGRIHSDAFLNHDPCTCPRTQEQEPLYLESEAFWIVRPELVLRENRRVGHRPFWAVVRGAETVDIDTQQDMDWARQVGEAKCRASR